MHHSGGAAAETNYIYGSVLNEAHQILRDSCKTCVVGLGLGYIEISWALSLIQNSITPSPEISFHSYEIVPGLIENFKLWVNSSSERSETIYDLITQKLSHETDPQAVKEILKQALTSGSTLNGDFQALENHQHSYNVICYDAFSKKTDEGLWEKNFLEAFIQKWAHETCCLTTYACTGVLKKTLSEQGFYFMKRPGFSGKRDSSLALRSSKLESLKRMIFQTSSYNQ